MTQTSPNPTGGTDRDQVVRVSIADDHAPTRAGVRMALEREGWEVCGEAANADQAIQAALRERPDVCLVDLAMPGGGIRAVAEISARLPHVPVLVLTVSRDANDLFDALRAGAAGYLLKDMDPAQLAGAVRAALNGEAPLSGVLTARLIDEFRHRGRRPTLTVHADRVTLTRREWDVVELLAEELSTAEIARRLFLSQVTVRRHVAALLHKLDVTTREEARLIITESMAPGGVHSRAATR